MTVSIVGAGPGDPSLVTVRALQLVRECDVLVYDRLVALELVREARSAELVERDRLRQDEVDALLVRHGRQGRAVVRLKGGDPFVFGRGAEEIEVLRAAGVPYELVPGLSTFTALPGLAGIPLTARGVAAQVTVLTGTTADGGDLDYDRLAATPGTLVVFMGLHRLSHIAGGLLRAGRPPGERAAVLSRLSLPDCEIRVGTLATIAQVAAGMSAPALVVIGDVVRFAAELQPGAVGAAA